LKIFSPNLSTGSVNCAEVDYYEIIALSTTLSELSFLPKQESLSNQQPPNKDPNIVLQGECALRETEGPITAQALRFASPELSWFLLFPFVFYIEDLDLCYCLVSFSSSRRPIEQVDLLLIYSKIFDLTNES
jgi:hypothetical protein